MDSTKKGRVYETRGHRAEKEIADLKAKIPQLQSELDESHRKLLRCRGGLFEVRAQKAYCFKISKELKKLQRQLESRLQLPLFPKR